MGGVIVRPVFTQLNRHLPDDRIREALYQVPESLTRLGLCKSARL